MTKFMAKFMDFLWIFYGLVRGNAAQFFAVGFRV